MPREIVLLTSEVEGPALANILCGHNPTLHVDTVSRLEDLQAYCLSDRDLSGARLIAFCTGIVVPEAVLKAFPGPSYNFHPGPPTFPGSHASGFAIYEGAEQFGVTAHVMEKRVDEGAIIGVEWFDLPGGVKYVELEVLAYKALIGMFKRLAGPLAESDGPLTPIAEAWSGRKRTKREVEAMKDLPDDVSEDEVRLRYRAFG